MAKTTSQIIAENKIKRGAADAAEASRNKIHQKQMAEVGAKSAARTAAVLNKAGIKTKTNPNTYEVSVDGDYTPRKKETAQRLDMQKKKEDRLEVKSTVNAAQIKRDRTKKQYDDYINSEEYRQKQAESVRAQQQAMDQDEMQVFSSTSDMMPPAPKDQKEYMLRMAKEAAEQEYNEAEDRKRFEADMEVITGLPEEQRLALERYSASKYGGRDIFGDETIDEMMEEYGRPRLDELERTFSRDKNAKRAEEVDAKAREFVSKRGGRGTLANILSIPVQAYSGIIGTGGQLAEMMIGTGGYKTQDPNAYGTIGQTLTGAIRGQTSENITEDLGDGFLGKAASTGYQAVMSAADSVARAYMGGNAFMGATLAATGSFSQTMADASKRGATPAQAALLATTTAGIEALSEKIPLDNLIRTAKGGSQTVMQMVKSALLQAGIEATTEEISLLGTVLADAAIMQEKSEYQLSITSKIMQGISPEQARDMANQELVNEAVNTALVSMVSGGMSSLGGSAVAKYRQNRAEAMANPAVNKPKNTQQATQTAIENNRARQERMAAEEAAQEAAQPQTEAQPVQKTDGELVQDTVANIVRQKQAAEAQTEQAPAQNQREENPDYEDEFENWGRDPNREGVADPMADRKSSEVGKRSVKAYMYENPDVKPFYQEQAAWMLSELRDSTKGERTYNEQLHYESGGEKGWSGNKRHTSDSIAQLLDEEGMSYEQIERGLNAIINDNGQENNAASKRIELIINDRLMNGYTDFYTGKRVEGNADYLNTLRKQQSAEQIQATSDTKQASAPTADMQMGASNQSAEGGRPDSRNSNTYMNTGLRSENANIRAGYRQDLKSDPDAAKYAVKHNADSLAEAKRRVATPESANTALDDLLSRNNWTAEDVATSTLLLDQIMESGDRNAIAKLADLRQARKNVGVAAGQVSQSFSIQNETMRDAASPATAVDTFRSNLDSMKESETTYSKKSGVDFETWKENIKTEVDNIGIAIATVEDGDSASMREIIKKIAKARKTTAWFGTTDRVTNTAWNVLKKLEFDDLKKIANTQVAAMADDYRRRSSGEVVGTIRKQNMLSSLKTFSRNIGGNAAGGIADAVSESGAGQMVDFLLSKVTGKRTVGNDLFRGKTYLNAAKEAGQFASLCVELNIPIETDVDSSFASAAGKSSNEKYVGKTFRATGNPAMRALYAYQKYMSHALEVTDKIFEGGSNAAVTESLNRLKNANLTDEEVQSLSQFALNKRTFKNATWEQDGKTKGSTLARKGTQLKNATGVIGEVAAPFVNVPMNVAQTGIDYTAGIAKSVYEIASIIKDAKAGKTIPVERQRQAASDFGRGVTGTVMIGMFTAAAAMGALKATEDEDWNKEALAQAEGRSGAQINWDALYRGLSGDSAEWKKGDTITSLDFLEPFNTQMYLGYEIANTKDMNALKYAGATIKSVWESLMDSPVMTGLSDIEDTINDIREAETPEDVANVAAGYAGDVATSFIPQYVRQIAQEMDGYYRDTRGATPMESAMNSVKAALPGLSQTLPKKYSGLGEVQERGSAAETFLDPTATKEYQKNEVTGYLDELTKRTGDDSIYPERQAPTRFEVGGKEVQLDGQMRETYQKTYGEKNAQLYGGLIGHKDFEKLPDELKTEAFKAAEGYSEDYAKAAVSDYKNVPKGKTTAQLVQDIIADAVRAKINGSFSDIDTAREYGYSTEETSAGMDEMFNVYKNLSSSTKENIMEEATGDTKKFLEVKSKGVSTKQFLDTTAKIDKLRPEPGYTTIRDIQTREAIAKMPGISDTAKDTLMKAYMTDYDPNDKSPQTTELKYDYARQELDLAPGEYTDVYRVQLDGGKKNEKIADWMAMGYTRAEANQFYRLFAATGRTKIDVVDWHNSQ